MAGEIRIGVASDAEAVRAWQEGRKLAIDLGFSRTDATFIATAISEIARNITAHAGEGEVVLAPLQEDDRDGLIVIARDEGPGIRDVESVAREEHHSHGGLGMGLRGARRLMDEFSIVSELGRGTTVTMKKWRGYDEVRRLIPG